MLTISYIGEPEDRAIWEQLLRDYDASKSADFVWGRLTNAQSQIKGIFVLNDQNIVGFAHYIERETTSGPEPECYIQDLFVDRSFRRQGAASFMLEWFKENKAVKDWSKVTLCTRANNYAAQALYEKLLRKNYNVHFIVA